MRVGAIVLAAGSGSRFGGGKLLAPLGGRPLLQHVLDAVAGAGIREVVVVLGADAATVEDAIAWRRERRIVNPSPEAGLGSSLRLGAAAATALDGPLDALLVALGDQPRVRSGVISSLVDAGLEAERGGGFGKPQPVIVPRYADDATRNPVLVRRAAWALFDEVSGDRGLGPLLEARPELVREVRVVGDNPDVDTPDDLARLERR